MKLELHFTNEEIMKFLTKHGYTFIFKIKNLPITIHGSTIDWEPRKTIYAEKDGKVEEYHTAFKELIKDKLLK